jgi:hypothetical protein
MENDRLKYLLDQQKIMKDASEKFMQELISKLPSNEEQLPKGVRKWGNKFRACIPTKKQIYLGIHATIEAAVAAQNEYRKEHGLPEPKIGRPKKSKP